MGGKAFNCAQLKQAGVAVPDGLVLTTEAMGTREFPELQAWLDNLPPGTQLAVRSSGVDEDSAGHSFAGIRYRESKMPPNCMVLRSVPVSPRPK